MSDTKKAPAAPPTALPMPKYQYQRPEQGSFSVRYQEKREATERTPALQNVVFAG